MPHPDLSTVAIVAAAYCLILAALFIAARRAPTCRCGDPKCGGGCVS